MRKLIEIRFNVLVILLTLFFAMSSCEKQDLIANSTRDAKVVDFVAEKCYCCWGWVIEVDEIIIKSENIPDLVLPTDFEGVNILRSSPLTGKIKIGEKLIDCEEDTPNYYNIIQFIQNK